MVRKVGHFTKMLSPEQIKEIPTPWLITTIMQNAFDLAELCDEWRIGKDYWDLRKHQEDLIIELKERQKTEKAYRCN